LNQTENLHVRHRFRGRSRNVPGARAVEKRTPTEATPCVKVRLHRNLSPDERLKGIPSLRWNRKTRYIAAFAAIAAYFIVALGLKYTYVDRYPKVKGADLVSFNRPFEQDKNAFTVRPQNWFPHSISFAGLADNETNNERSPVLIYEDGVPIGPAHSSYADVRDLGMGRYTHWTNQGFIFSSSDNSDPNTNNRQYWAVLPIDPPSK
jgi:hypothetical protein